MDAKTVVNTAYSMPLIRPAYPITDRYRTDLASQHNADQVSACGIDDLQPVTVLASSEISSKTIGHSKEQ